MERKPKYAGWGLALGAVLGALFGLLAGNIGIWLGIGVAIGMLLGATVRPKQPECPRCAAMHQGHARGTE